MYDLAGEDLIICMTWLGGRGFKFLSPFCQTESDIGWYW